MSGSNIEKTVETDVVGTATKGVSFFVRHPKAIAIGAGVAGIIVGFLIHGII